MSEAPMRAGDAILIGCALTVTAACASGGAATGKKTPCDLRRDDAQYAAGEPLYRDCAVDIKAHLETSTTADFQPSAPRTACYSVDLEFVVDSMGRPEPKTVRVVRSNDQTYAQAVANTVPQWRYKPAQLAGHPVRQIASERRSTAIMVAVVRAGSGPPSRGAMPRPPNC